MSKIFLYGSCISRDSFEYFDGSHELLSYVARQSIISAMSKPTRLLSKVGLDSAFQNRMLDGDIDSNLMTLIERHANTMDLLMIDLTDERLGVHKLPDGSFVTRSVELVKSSRLEQISPVSGVIQIGSERHTMFWINAAKKFYSKLDQLGLRDKTLVVNAPWAIESVDGTSVPEFRNIPTIEMNERLQNCAEIVRSLGYKVVDMPDALAVTTRQHKWGIAPYHYSEPAYLWIRDQALNALGQGKQ